MISAPMILAALRSANGGVGANDSDAYEQPQNAIEAAKDSSDPALEENGIKSETDANGGGSTENGSGRSKLEILFEGFDATADRKPVTQVAVCAHEYRSRKVLL